MAGAFVCASLGIVPTVRHADYIGSWLEVLREDNGRGYLDQAGPAAAFTASRLEFSASSLFSQRSGSGRCRPEAQ
jgi:antirestriction protein ArdC